MNSVTTNLITGFNQQKAPNHVFVSGYSIVSLRKFDLLSAQALLPVPVNPLSAIIGLALKLQGV